MSASALKLSLPRTRTRPFFLIMSFVLTGIVVLGFSRTVPFDLAAPGFPALLWVHGAVFASWVLLFMVQPALVMAGLLRWHRALGWVGMGLAAAMVALGAIAILMALWADHVPDFYPHGLFLVRGAIGLLMFSGLITAGIISRRRGAWHKRFLLCASVVVITPGLERAMPLALFGTNWPFAADATLDALLLAGPVTDRIWQGRVHPAYVWAIGAILVGQGAVYAAAWSPVATFLLHVLGAR